MKKWLSILLIVLFIIFAIYNAYLFIKIGRAYLAGFSLLGSYKLSMALYTLIPLVQAILLFIAGIIFYKKFS